MEKTINNRAQVYVLKLTGKENEHTVYQLLQLLPPANQQRFSLYTNVRSKIQSIAGEVLARYASGCFESAPFNTSDIIIGKNGKPSFITNDSLHFNISHSGNYIVCAVCNSDIGIDVERVRNVNLRIAERYFSSHELTDLMNLEPDERMDYFIRLWTIKESYLKALGTGLTMKLNSFTIVQNQNIFQLTGSANAIKQDVISIKLDPSYYMAVCAAKTLYLESINYIGMNELLVK